MATFQRRQANTGWVKTALSLLENISVILLAILGPMIAPPKQYHFEEHNNHQDHSSFFSSSSSTTEDVELVEAYLFFDLKRGKCTEDDLNRAWKLLSRKHHPDRNNQSRESVAMTQKMNHYKELILRKDFSSNEDSCGEGKHDEADTNCDWDCARGYESEDRDFFEFPKQRPKAKAKKHKKERHQQRKKKKQPKHKRRNSQGSFPPNDDFFDNCYDNASYFEEQDEYSGSSEVKEFADNMKNVEKEQEKIEIGLRALHTGLKRDIKKDKQNGDLYRRHRGIDTSTAEGRDKAHVIWVQSQKSGRRENKDSDHEVPPSTRASSSSLDDIDDDDDDGDNVSNSEAQNDAKKPADSSGPNKLEPDVPEKPINLTMEQCTNKIVIAVRLGFHDTAADILGMACSRAADRYMYTNGHSGDVYKAVQELLEKPLDYDENTLWHYAAYYESDKLLSSLLATYSHVTEANEDSKLLNPPEPLAMMLKENARGQTPQDFLRGDPGSYMDQRVRTLTAMARKARRDNTLEQRFLSLLKNVDAFAVLYSCGMYLVVCRYFFGCGRPLSFVVCFAQSKLMVDEPRQRIIYTMLLLGTYKVSIRPCLSWISYFFWTTWARLFVSVVTVYILKKLKAMKYVFSIAAWLNLAIFQFVGLRIARFSDRLDAELLTKLIRSNKWVAANPNVNGLLYLVIYSSLFFGVQWSIQHVVSIAYFSVVGRDVIDRGMGFNDNGFHGPQTE